EADLIIAVGARFSDRVTGKLDTFAPNAKIIHIDIDAAEIGKNVKTHIPIVGDVKKALSELITRVQPVEGYGEWHHTIDRWKDEYPLTYSASEQDGYIRPQYVIEQISDLTQGDAIVTTEVGQHQMWTAQFYKFKHPRTFITSGGLGTMGYGLPAAIGAKVGRPDKLVIDISGDGSFQMNVQEMATAVEQRLPIVICILNNGYLGMVRQWQQLFFNGRYSYTDMKGQPDFVKLAEAYGAVGMRINKESQVAEALKTAFTVTDRPVVIDFLVEPEANVFPMVAPGDSLTNMMGGDDI
ncbi:MAG: thiamine pyrophosphate-dependent enzyme, partial [Methylocystaceae bacterium]